MLSARQSRLMFGSLFVNAATAVMAVSTASAQITIYDTAKSWNAAASSIGPVQCENVESDTVGNYLTPYVTTAGWAFTGQAGPVTFQVVGGGDVNGTQEVRFRDPMLVRSPCDPCVGMSFSYFSTVPWTVTVDNQNYPLQANVVGFFGFTSNTPVTSITLTPGGGNIFISLDDLCCVTHDQGQEFGACCYKDATGVMTCAVVTAAECKGLGGTFFGVGSTCDPTTCDEPGGGECEEVAGDCCAGRPQIDDPFYATFPPLVSVGTASIQAQGSSVVTIFGLNNPNAGPFNQDFGAPMYSHASWSESNLGSVFGVGLDPSGNIYVTATRCYGQFATSAGSLGGNFGIVYRLDGLSGIASVFAALPNSNDTGLGNIDYDCGHDQFFVTNMEDGMIYRLSTGGVVLSTFDHGTPDDPSNTFPPLGDRVWAVAVHNNRVFYSVWWEDAGNPSATVANEIWSIALDGSGDFTGTAQLEVTIPAMTQSYSNPVSDIRFSPTGTMLVAERGMSSATEPTPHQSRLLEFKCSNGAWTLSGNTFSVGIGNGENTAGGVDMDYSVGGRVYATGDALRLDQVEQVYGTQGLPATGGTTANSILIDFNGNLTVQDKTQIGSVAVPCPGPPEPPCFNVSQMKVLCPAAGSNCFTATFNLTNKSEFSVKYVSIPLHPDPNSPITINPNIINLLAQDGSLLDPGETTTITLTICGAAPGDEFCLEIGFMTANFVTCCFDEVCFVMPLCDCGQLMEQEMSKIICSSNGTVSFNYSFTLQNLSTFAADWVIFIPFKDEQATFAKDFFFLPPLVPGGTFPMRVDIQGAVPGETFCFYVLLQHPSGSLDDCCCAFEKCITVPECDQAPNQTCPGDVNVDNAVDVSDLLAVINGWGPCSAPCPPYCLADVNGDCTVNVSDLLLVINNWGPCPNP